MQETMSINKLQELADKYTNLLSMPNVKIVTAVEFSNITGDKDFLNKANIIDGCHYNGGYIYINCNQNYENISTSDFADSEYYIDSIYIRLFKQYNIDIEYYDAIYTLYHEITHHYQELVVSSIIETDDLVRKIYILNRYLLDTFPNIYEHRYEKFPCERHAQIMGTILLKQYFESRGITNDEKEFCNRLLAYRLIQNYETGSTDYIKKEILDISYLPRISQETKTNPEMYKLVYDTSQSPIEDLKRTLLIRNMHGEANFIVELINNNKFNLLDTLLYGFPVNKKIIEDLSAICYGNKKVDDIIKYLFTFGFSKKEAIVSDKVPERLSNNK